MGITNTGRRVLPWAILSACICTAAVAAPPTPGTVESTVSPTPALEPPAGLPEGVAPPPPPRRAVPEGGRQIEVSRIVVTGNTVLTDAQIRSVTSPHEGNRLTLAQIYDIADKLTTLYRAEGYAVATATVPPQKIESGEVRIEVIEGAIDTVVAQGNRRYSDEYLRRQMNELRDGEILTIETMEREMLLLNDLPGLTARSVIRPGSSYGTSQVLVNAVEDPFDAYLRGTNYGREDVGEWRAEGGAGFNNLLGVGDRLSVDFIHSESDLLNYFNLGYSVALTHSGTRAAFSYSEADFEVGGRFSALGINGDSKIARFSVTHPLVRSRATNVLVGVGLSHKESESVIGALRTPGVPARSTDAAINLVDLSLIASWLHPDKSATNLAAVLWSNGRKRSAGDDDIGADGLPPDENRLRAKLRIDANHLRPLPWWNTRLFLRAAAVASPDPLTDSEKFGIGGPADVRGFPISELRGDDGVSLTLEVRRPFDLGSALGLARKMPASGRVFWDGGRVHRKKPSAGFGSTESLTSAGAGLTLLPAPQLQLDVMVAKPLNSLDVSDGADSGRWWVSLTNRF